MPDVADISFDIISIICLYPLVRVSFCLKLTIGIIKASNYVSGFCGQYKGNYNM
jgi:hypothetical protein